jgi:hypothetical protein
MSEDKEVLFEIFGTQVKTSTVVALIFIGIVGWWLLHVFFATTIPGNWLEKGDYEAKVYVNLFPDDDSTKNYRLVGDIERSSDCDSDGESSSCYSSYYLHKITFPDEGHIAFDDCTIELHKKNYCQDDDGTDWDVELTDQLPK